MEAQHTKHVTYKLAYHFVWCPKYRKRILTGKIAAFVEQEIRRICENNTWTRGALTLQEDHVHLFGKGFLLHVDGISPTFTERMDEHQKNRNTPSP